MSKELHRRKHEKKKGDKRGADDSESEEEEDMELSDEEVRHSRLKRDHFNTCDPGVALIAARVQILRLSLVFVGTGK